MTQEPNPFTVPIDTKSDASKSRDRYWFIASTMLGFLGLLFKKQYYFTGQALIVSPLWRYYVIEVRNGFPSLSGTSIGGPKNLIVATMAIHLGLSVLFGLLVYGIRWLVLCRRKES